MLILSEKLTTFSLKKLTTPEGIAAYSFVSVRGFPGGPLPVQRLSHSIGVRKTGVWEPRRAILRGRVSIYHPPVFRPPLVFVR
jgi:hypothetical protein